MVPVAEWLNAFNLQGSREAWLKDVLMNVAELLKLQDLVSIQLHVALMGNSFPDLRYIFHAVPWTTTLIAGVTTVMKAAQKLHIFSVENFSENSSRKKDQDVWMDVCQVHP